MDLGSAYTDIQIAKMERRIRDIYSEAQTDIEQKMLDFNRKRNIKDKIKLRELREGKITQEEYNRWVAGQAFQGKQWVAKRQQIEEVLTNSNEVATRLVNGEKSKVFMANSNYQAYELEHGAGVNFGFNLYDSATVAKLIESQPDLLPMSRVNIPKDMAWNSKTISREIAKGIIEGESLDKIAKRLSVKTGSTNMNSMLTHARTAMTGAQNAGRIIRLNEAETKGIKVKKEWMATLDEHTRTTHRELDGQKRPVNEPFQVDGYSIMYPGDPHAHPSMVYNCRCTLVGDLVDYPAEYDRVDNINGDIIKNMTYKEWSAAKKGDTSTYTDFLEIRKSLGNEFVNAMETMLNFTQEEDAAKLFYKFQHMLRVADAHRADGGACFKRSDGVHVNVDKIQQGDDLHVPYQTVFHEFGHNIDNAASFGGMADDAYISIRYKGGALEKKIKEDWNEFRVKFLLEHPESWNANKDWRIRNVLRDMASKDVKYDPSSSKWYDLLRQLRAGEITNEEVLSKYGDKIVRNYLMDKTRRYFTDTEIVDMLKAENMPLHVRGSISDIIGGLMCSRGEHDPWAYPLGAGHEADYWWKYKFTRAGEMIKVSSEALPKEFFAEVIDGKIANPESLAQMRRVFPRSVKMVEQIIQEALK